MVNVMSEKLITNPPPPTAQRQSQQAEYGKQQRRGLGDDLEAVIGDEGLGKVTQAVLPVGSDADDLVHVDLTE